MWEIKKIKIMKKEKFSFMHAVLVFACYFIIPPIHAVVKYIRCPNHEWEQRNIVDYGEGGREIEYKCSRCGLIDIMEE